MEGDCCKYINVDNAHGGTTAGPFSVGFAEAGNWITDKKWGDLHLGSSLFEINWITFFSLDFPLILTLYTDLHSANVANGYMSLLCATPPESIGHYAIDNIIDMTLLSLFDYQYSIYVPKFPLSYLILQKLDESIINDINDYNLYKNFVVTALDSSNNCGFWNIWVNYIDNNSYKENISDFFWSRPGSKDGSIGFLDGKAYMLLHNLYWLFYLEDYTNNKYWYSDLPNCNSQTCIGSHDNPLVVESSNNYYVSSTIESDGNVKITGNTISLLNGFEAKRGSYFEAIATGHTDPNIYEYKFYRPPCDFSYLGDAYTPPSKDNSICGTEGNNNNTDNQEQDELDVDVKFFVDIYPNPFVADVSLTYYLPKESSCSISIFNMSGFSVYKFDQLLSKGYHSNSIDLSDVSAGIYICVISTNNGIETIKIIKE